MHQLDRGIFYEDAYLGVTLGALVFSHGVISIDAPLRPEDARSWRSVLLNQRGGSNRLIISLDAHPDRTLGTRAFDCPIVAHQKAAQVFRNRPTIFKGQSAEGGAVWESYTDAIGMRWAAPDVTFTDALSLHWGGPEVVLEYHPGPAPGAIWVVIPQAGVVFCGDAVVINQPPFLAHADLEGWLQNLELLQSQYSGYLLVSGRGGLATAEHVQLQQKVLQQVLAAFEAINRKNASPETLTRLASDLLSNYRFPAEMHEIYLQRLRTGLQQCFNRRYRSSTVNGKMEMDSEE